MLSFSSTRALCNDHAAIYKSSENKYGYDDQETQDSAMLLKLSKIFWCVWDGFPGFYYVLSRVLLFVTPWTVAHQVPLSTGFPRQEYWSRLVFTSPGDLPDPGIKPESPALAGRFFTTEPPGKPQAPLERRIKTRIHSFVKLEMVNWNLSRQIITVNISCFHAANPDLVFHGLPWFLTLFLMSFSFYIYLFIWLCQALVIARGIFLVAAYKVLVAVCELLAAGCAI